jgi:hypothetical protein
MFLKPVSTHELIFGIRFMGLLNFEFKSIKKEKEILWKESYSMMTFHGKCTKETRTTITNSSGNIFLKSIGVS